MRSLYILFALLLITNCNRLISQESISDEESETTEIDVLFPGHSKAERVTVEVVEGQYIFEGDIIVDEYGESDEEGRGGATIFDGQLNQRYKWANSTIPYVLPNDIIIKGTIEWAISELNSKTNLCLVPKTSAHTSWIKFNCLEGRGGGSSSLGRQGGEQLVNIGETADKGTSIHEIMHAAGFYHEQCRLDRDDHVEIIWDNIAKKEHNFYKLDQKMGGRDIGSYNFGSVMHYSSTAFGKRDPDNSRRRLTTIRTKNGETIGQRRRISPGDIGAINDVYAGCSSSATASGGSSSEKPNFLESIWNYVWPFDEESDSGRGGGGNSSSFDIQYDVELVAQQTDMSCWAAAAAMLVGWLDEVCIDPAEIARGVGYWSQYQQGLMASDTTVFRYWGLQAEPPQSYEPRGFVNLLAGYGPLWVATFEGGPHARVITGASGDGTAEGTILTVYDPWQLGMRRFRANNTGSTYTESFAQFERKNHQLARREMNEPAPIYVAHNH